MPCGRPARARMDPTAPIGLPNFGKGEPMRDIRIDEAQAQESKFIGLPKQKWNGREVNAWLDQDFNELAFSPCELAAALGVDEADFDQVFPGLFRINGALPPVFFSELPGFILGLARWRKYQGLSELPCPPVPAGRCESCGKPVEDCMDGDECGLGMVDMAGAPGGTVKARLN